MRIAIFLDGLGLGGTEKAACSWALGLKRNGHQVFVIALSDGSRKKSLTDQGIDIEVVPQEAEKIAEKLRYFAVDVTHIHSPGFSHPGDILEEALVHLEKRIPVVETNIFGRLENSLARPWVNFRLFISWTSCIQAAQRHFYQLDDRFFERQSVAVYPIEDDNGASQEEINSWRSSHGVAPNEVLWGRFSRPEPNKWSALLLPAFKEALRKQPNLKLLLQSPPAEIAEELKQDLLSSQFLVLPPTSDPKELRLAMSSIDAVLHTSSIGESFGYGIAEPMNYAKPAIVHSVPWIDQAQLELIEHRKCGIHASTIETMANAILEISNDATLRHQFGITAQQRIRQIASKEESLDRLEAALAAAVRNEKNYHLKEDLIRAEAAADYLRQNQFGHTWKEQIALRPFYYRVRFSQWRNTFTTKTSLPSRTGHHEECNK